MQIVQNHDIDINRWNSLLEHNDFASPFQTKQYYDFLNSLNGFSADVFALEENDQYICLVVVSIQKEKGIKSFFSKRGIIYSGPLVADKTNNDGASLFRYITRYYKRKLIYLEIKNYFDYSYFRAGFTNSGFEYIPWLNFQLKTSDLEAMKKNISNSRLRQINKAMKYGVSWKEAESITEILSFYDILRDLYYSKIKKPLPPVEFFTEFFNQKIGKYLMIYYNDRIIGGIMCPIYRSKIIYEFYICGLDREFKNQHPSAMATYAAMEYAHQNGIKLFDFMGAGIQDAEYGVREFKARFGGELVEYGRYKYICQPLLYKIGKVGLKLMSII